MQKHFRHVWHDVLLLAILGALLLAGSATMTADSEFWSDFADPKSSSSLAQTLCGVTGLAIAAVSMHALLHLRQLWACMHTQTNPTRNADS